MRLNFHSYYILRFNNKKKVLKVICCLKNSLGIYPNYIHKKFPLHSKIKAKLRVSIFFKATFQTISLLMYVLFFNIEQKNNKYDFLVSNSLLICKNVNQANILFNCFCFFYKVNVCSLKMFNKILSKIKKNQMRF